MPTNGYALYNENDPKAAAWLRELIRQGHIADGKVDERSIEDLEPSYVKEFTQFHAFAGIAGWSKALRQSGWPDDRPVWTGSCPCQPFSQAGKGNGFADERHLWPAFHWLIKQCEPDTVFGEQVAEEAGLTWFDTVSNDLENEGYTVGAAVTSASMLGAPHQRKRLYFVGALGDCDKRGCQYAANSDAIAGQKRRGQTKRGCDADKLANNQRNEQRQRRGSRGKNKPGNESGIKSGRRGQASNMANDDGMRLTWQRRKRQKRITKHSEADGPTATNGFWSNPDWIYCRDGKWRPIKSGVEPLVNGAANRVAKLHGLGNAIVVPQATAFIESYMEVMGDH